MQKLHLWVLAAQERERKQPDSFSLPAPILTFFLVYLRRWLAIWKMHMKLHPRMSLYSVAKGTQSMHQVRQKHLSCICHSNLLCVRFGKSFHGHLLCPHENLTVGKSEDMHWSFRLLRDSHACEHTHKNHMMKIWGKV